MYPPLHDHGIGIDPVRHRLKVIEIRYASVESKADNRGKNERATFRQTHLWRRVQSPHNLVLSPFPDGATVLVSVKLEG